MRGLALRLDASLGASSPLGDSLTKGELREEDLVSAFRPYIARRYDLVKGLVVNADGDESDPQDLILLDSFALPSILGAGNTRLVPVEGVVGTIQIKSIATTQSVRSAIRNIASAKRLLASELRYGLPLNSSKRPQLQYTSASFFGGVLFLSMRDKPETIMDAYYEDIVKIDPRERCDALCVSNQFSILWGDPSTGGPGVHFSFRGEQAETPLRIMAGHDSLLFFYLALSGHLANWITPPMPWLDYVFKARTIEFEYSYAYDEENPPAWLEHWNNAQDG